MDRSAPAADPLPGTTRRGNRAEVALHRALRTERTMVKMRWGAVVFAFVQVLTFYLPYPPGVLPFALGLVAVLAVGNIAIQLRLRAGVTSLATARRLGMAALTLDVAAAMSLVLVYTFDPNTMMFAILYILPLEAALRFQLRGALTTMAVITALYALREVYGSIVYDIEFLIVSINFRMGIGFLIAYVAGQMASSLVHDRTELEGAKDELERAATQLAATNAELATANEIKDDFLAMTNHELRTPLTTVLGYTAMLRQRWDAIPDERRQEFIGRIEEQGLRLQSMVESLLTLSSAQAGALQLQVQPVDVRAAVDEAIRHHGLAGQSFANECPAGLHAFADRVRLGQVLVNYLSNARKYGAPPITVSAQADDDCVTIAVEDRGEGVPETFVPRLFDKFSQASQGDSRTAEGTGLGLAIVRQLARAQGGEAWYEPGEPHGSRFLVRLRRSGDVAMPVSGEGDERLGVQGPSARQP
jgi:signal transduction histidine kinase